MSPAEILAWLEARAAAGEHVLLDPPCPREVPAEEDPHDLWGPTPASVHVGRGERAMERMGVGDTLTAALQDAAGDGARALAFNAEVDAAFAGLHGEAEG